MKEIFSYNKDIEKNAYMNWRTQRFDHIHNMIVVAEGFSDSALFLVKGVASGKCGFTTLRKFPH